MNQFSIGIGNKRGVSVSLSRRCAMYVQCCAVMCSAVQEGMDRAITQYFRQIAVISDPATHSASASTASHRLFASFASERSRVVSPVCVWPMAMWCALV